MDQDRIKGNWKQIKGRAKERFGVLIDDNEMENKGHVEYLIGKLQEKLGVTRDEAREKVRELERAA